MKHQPWTETIGLLFLLGKIETGHPKTSVDGF
jgi:hypothetical protein